MQGSWENPRTTHILYHETHTSPRCNLSIGCPNQHALAEKVWLTNSRNYPCMLQLYYYGSKTRSFDLHKVAAGASEVGPGILWRLCYATELAIVHTDVMLLMIDTNWVRAGSRESAVDSTRFIVKVLTCIYVWLITPFLEQSRLFKEKSATEHYLQALFVVEDEQRVFFSSAAPCRFRSAPKRNTQETVSHNSLRRNQSYLHGILLLLRSNLFRSRQYSPFSPTLPKPAGSCPTSAGRTSSFVQLEEFLRLLPPRDWSTFYRRS